MTYVVTRLCQGCKDTACMAVCPVDCFYEPTTPSTAKPDMLYINPDECIDCDACVPECPWEAIYAEADVPAPFKEEIALNRLTMDEPEAFKKAVSIEKPKPEAEAVALNKTKWGI